MNNLLKLRRGLILLALLGGIIGILIDYRGMWLVLPYIIAIVIVLISYIIKPRK